MFRTGAEVLATEGFARLLGKRVAVLANPSSLLRVGPGGLRGLPASARQHLVTALLAAGVDVVRLFGPEHGLWATAQDLIAVEGGDDPVFDRPVSTLYGRTVDTLTPRPEALAGIDVLVFDVQDVGARYYTYAATLCMALQVCAQVGVQVVVLDRPNPLGGEVIEGNALPEFYRSFVGWIDVPQRHGLTVGEIARLYAAEQGLAVDLDVVPCAEWNPALYFDEIDFGRAGSPWYAPSPNMPTVTTAVVYPGGCLVEGTRLSEGRGTTRPFELIGAPWLDARRYAEVLQGVGVPGLHVRAMRFGPTFQKFVGEVCGGVAVEVTERAQFAAVRSGIALLAAARVLAPQHFAWRTETYEFVSDRLAIDLLMGGPRAREAIESCADVADLPAALDQACADFAQGERAFAERARAWLLYPRQNGPLAMPAAKARAAGVPV